MPKGGARVGAGRKSKAALLLDAQAHANAVAGFFTLQVQESTWIELLASSDEQVKLKALCYLTDKMYGKAHQSMNMTLEGDESLKNRLKEARARRDK